MKTLAFLSVLLLGVSPARAQTVSERGFVEGRGFWYFEEAPNDPEQLVGDALWRQEVTLRPAQWFEVTGGVEARANSYDQVEDEWRLDWDDRGILRPRLALRTAAATIRAGHFRLDVGKQFVRWGRADIIYPTDRFAPRDYMNVITTELLPVLGARASIQAGNETFEGVWVPRLTPSRLPLADQRWAPSVPGGAALLDAGGTIPGGSQFGARWRHTGSRIETAVSFFDGFNHQPDIELTPRPVLGAIEFRRVYPTIRMYGGDVAIPTPWVTIKAEMAYVTSPPETSDEYALYVIELERQAGNWLLDGGYANEDVRIRRVAATFSPDRSLAGSIIGRASYSEDPKQTLVFEAAIDRHGDGYYSKAEFSQGMGRHWRLTVTGVALGGEDTNFLGQYRRNSHGEVALRFSY